MEQDRMIRTKGLVAQFVDVMMIHHIINGKTYKQSFASSMTQHFLNFGSILVYASFLYVGIVAYSESRLMVELFGVCLVSRELFSVIPTSYQLEEVKEA